MEQILMIFGIIFLAGALIAYYFTSVYYRGKLESQENSFDDEISALEAEIAELKKVKNNISQLNG